MEPAEPMFLLKSGACQPLWDQQELCLSFKAIRQDPPTFKGLMVSLVCHLALNRLDETHPLRSAVYGFRC